MMSSITSNSISAGLAIFSLGFTPNVGNK